MLLYMTLAHGGVCRYIRPLQMCGATYGHSLSTVLKGWNLQLLASHGIA